MLGEAAATGRPLFIFDVGDGDTAWWRLSHNYRYKPLSHHFAMRFGPQRMRRDVGKIQSALVASGQAMWLDADGIAGAAGSLSRRHQERSAPPARRSPATAEQELQRTAEAVRRLLTDR